MSAPEAQSREQMLRVAEKLFCERGYTAVRLRDIADALGVRQAALYYHVPAGKEQIFVEVIKRSFQRHRAGLEQASAQAAPHVSAQLTAMADWLLSQSPLGLSRLARSDLPMLSATNAQTIADLGIIALIEPIQQVLHAAYQRGEVRLLDTQMMSTVFLSMIDTIHDMYQSKHIAKEVLARDIIDVLLHGMLRQ